MNDGGFLPAKVWAWRCVRCQRENLQAVRGLTKGGEVIPVACPFCGAGGRRTVEPAALRPDRRRSRRTQPQT